MIHEPAAPVQDDRAVSYKMRLGVWMFAAYCLFYAGFVGLNLLSPALMGQPVLLGLNLATVYGVALIVVALLQALLYDALCRRQERVLNASATGSEGR